MQAKHIIGDFEGFFEEGQEFFDTKIILSRRTKRNRRLCVLPAYKNSITNYQNHPYIGYFYVPLRQNAMPNQNFYRCLSFILSYLRSLEMHSQHLYLSVLRICAPQPWLIFRSSGFRLVAFTLTKPKKVKFKKKYARKKIVLKFFTIYCRLRAF